MSPQSPKGNFYIKNLSPLLQQEMPGIGHSSYLHLGKEAYSLLYLPITHPPD